MSKDEKKAEAKGERIAKVIARAGVCSRREAERLIEQGRVAVDGKTLKTPAVLVVSGSIVTIDGEPLSAPERTRLFRYHKPAGVLTAERDPQGRPTIYDTFPPGVPRLMPVGRLDFNSEGLLLLTNDGGLKRHLELPATGWIRRYRVRVFGQPDPAALKRLAKGTTIEGIQYGPIEASIDSVKGSNAWLTVSLREGKNREVRRVMEDLGLQVNRLIRIAYGPFQLGDIPRGGAEEVPRKMLREQLGAMLDGPRTGKR
ncbi:MAG TPA: pseudouridine synthase [Alphaproteobacteria bacterium]|nr:pseudouridine synthase [Alphaproteobacteria bacterium]